MVFYLIFFWVHLMPSKIFQNIEKLILGVLVL